MRARVVIAALAVAMSWGCSSAGSSGAASGAPHAPSRSADVITQDEIASRATDASNALQIIEKLRPQMLRPRGHVPAGNMSTEGAVEASPKVYVDNVLLGEINSLGNVSATQVKEIRYVNARDATTQWGTNHMGGVILILTRK